MNLKLIAIVGLLVVGVGAVAATMLGIGTGSSTATTYRTTTAETMTVSQTVPMSGNLASATEYDLVFGETPVARDGTSSSTSTAATDTSSAATGAATETAVTWPVTEVMVNVGDQVKAGDLLATADATTADLAVRQARADLAAARRQLRLDQQGGDSLSRASARDQVASARDQLSNARASYSNTVAQSSLQVRQARRSVSDAEAKLKADKRAGAAKAVLNADRASIRSAKGQLAQTQLQASSGNRSASNQITSARRSLTSAQRQRNSATSSADDATLIADEVAIQRARQTLADAEAALGAATLVAPIDGRITEINVAVGEDAAGTAMVLQSDTLAIALSVTEDEVLDLSDGQEATVSITATGETATGHVTSIDPVATSTDASGVVSYAVVVTLNDPAGNGLDAETTSAAPAETDGFTALPGMSADVTVVIDQATDAVAVPSIAVTGTLGEYSVRVMGADGTVSTRPVEVGIIASDYTQITSGVGVGETVVTGSSADRAATSTTGNGTGGGFVGGPGAFPGGGGGNFQPPAGGFQP